MSVVVKGMRLPTRCLECPMYDGYNYSCKPCSFRIPARYNYEGATRPDWCPLVDLGKHGWLIDFDALIEKYWDGNSMMITEWDLKDIKAVIEAEDGNDDHER